MTENGENAEDVVLAKDAEIDGVYLSRGGREVIVIQKSSNHVKLEVKTTKNKCPVPLDYPLVKLGKGVRPREEEEEEVSSSGSGKEKPKEKKSKEKKEKSKKPVKVSSGTVKGTILGLLQSGGRYTVDELAEHANAAKTTVRLKLSELRREDGVVIRREKKKYFMEEE